MKYYFRLTLLLGVLFFCTNAGYAQMVSLEKAKEVSGMKAGEWTAKIIMISTSDNMELTHEMGNEKAVKILEGDNTYRYELTHHFNEDQQDAGFCKTTVKVILPEGGETFRLVLYPDKCYKGSFKLAGITCVESAGGVYAQAGKSKVVFSSQYKDLSIWCNGILFFDQGKLSPNDSQHVVGNLSADNGLTDYELIFTLAGSDESPNPVFKVKTPTSGTLNVKLDKEMVARTSYKFNVVKSVKTIERVFSFGEKLAVAQKYWNEYPSVTESSFFEAGENAFAEVLNHKDCPVAERDSFYAKKNRLAAIRVDTYKKQRAHEVFLQREASLGYEAEGTFKFLMAERNFCRRIVERYPELAGYKTELEELEKKLLNHPARETTVVRRAYQVITGKVTKNDSYVGDISGTEIYGTNDAKGKKENRVRLGKVGSDGNYKIVLKEPYNYLFFYGEKEARPISTDIETLDVELTR